ncbi:MAG: TusE/DsrC/DsvC family sulfur relay protein [Thermodesulfovibrionales bacterium]|nr:TusE/DsrC/DsvC family sulfur relay protein [Thermodesulfovibrionales bacterium]
MMQTMEYRGKKVTIDDEGYLLNFNDWSEDVACALAEKEGVEELTKDKMDIIKFLREYYKEHKFFPILRAVCKNVHQPKNCITENFMNPVKAWKIAGLPNPGEEVNLFKTWEPLGF